MGLNVTVYKHTTSDDYDCMDGEVDHEFFGGSHVGHGAFRALLAEISPDFDALSLGGSYASSVGLISGSSCQALLKAFVTHASEFNRRGDEILRDRYAEWHRAVKVAAEHQGCLVLM